MIATTPEYDAINAQLVKHPVYLVEIDGYSRAFISWDLGVSGQDPWITDMADYKISVSDLDGSADQGTLTFTVQDKDRQILESFPGFVFEGKDVVLKQGFIGLDQDKWATLFTGVVDSVAAANDNLEYAFTCDNEPAQLQNTIYEVGDSGRPTDSDNPRTVLGHPIDIMIDVLVNQLGIDVSKVDLTKLHDYRDGIFSGVEFEFILTTAPVAKDFIEGQLLKPLGGYRWVNSQGLITANFFYTTNTAALGDLPKSAIIGVPVAVQSDLINIVTFLFDQTNDTGSNSSGYLASATKKYGPSIAKYGLFGATEIDSDGMRSGFQGFFQAALVSRLIFYRYGQKGDKFDPVTLVMNHVKWEPGDIVTMTCDLVPDRANGVMGISARKYEVMDKNINFHDGQVELTLLDASFLDKFGRFFISPAGEPAFPGDTSINEAHYMYLCDDTDRYSDTTPAHTLG